MKPLRVVPEEAGSPDAACAGVESDQLHEVCAVLVAQGVHIKPENLVLLEVVHRVDNVGSLLVRDLLFLAPTRGESRPGDRGQVSLGFFAFAAPPVPSEIEGLEKAGLDEHAFIDDRAFRGWRE